MRWLTLLLSTGLLSLPTQADNFPKLDEAMPASISIRTITPLFDFDSDGCLPSAGISRDGRQNGGLKPSGGMTAGCRWTNFLEQSNTLHRYACLSQNGDHYCGHFFALYFLKDQVLNGINSGHRHDWEHVAIWTRNGNVTHASYSAHGKLTTSAISDLEQEQGHVKFVYHKDGILTHALRFANRNEQAENPYGSFVTPDITSWYTISGDGFDNEAMRQRLNSYDYGSATIPMMDNNFLTHLNEARPAGYPEFTATSVSTSH